MATTKFHPDSRQVKAGKDTVSVHVTLTCGTPVRLATGLKIALKDWDQNNQEVKGKSTAAQNANRLLRRIKTLWEITLPDLHYEKYGKSPGAKEMQWMISRYRDAMDLDPSKYEQKLKEHDDDSSLISIIEKYEADKHDMVSNTTKLSTKRIKKNLILFNKMKGETLDPEKWDTDHARKYVRFLFQDKLPTKKRYKNASIHSEMSFIKTYLNHSNVKVNFVLSKVLKDLKVETGNRVFIVQRHLIDLITNFKYEGSEKTIEKIEKMKALITVAFETGMRHNEMWDLQRKDISVHKPTFADGTRREVKILTYRVSKQSKSRKSVTNNIIVTPAMEKVFDEWEEKLKNEPTIYNDGKIAYNHYPIVPYIKDVDRQLKYMLEQVAKWQMQQEYGDNWQGQPAVGLYREVTVSVNRGYSSNNKNTENRPLYKVVTFHFFRHGKAAEMRAEGTSDERIAAQLGDSVETIRRHYPDNDPLKVVLNYAAGRI